MLSVLCLNPTSILCYATEVGGGRERGEVEVVVFVVVVVAVVIVVPAVC
jgi:hypothetical protein